VVPAAPAVRPPRARRPRRVRARCQCARLRGFAESYLPKGLQSYDRAVHDLALTLYAEAAPGKSYFLDKTPRYHHVARDLLRIFPDGRFVFLWRQPLAVAASLIDTFGHGGWNLDTYSADLFRGLPELVAAFEENRDRVVAVRYEDLVAEPVSEITHLLRYLDLPADESIVTRFGDLEMKNPDYWDPSGTARYDHVSPASLDRWRVTMTNPLRKAWCRRYVRWLGERRLATMGYDQDELLGEVEAIRTSSRGFASDLIRAAGGYGYRHLRARLLRSSFPLWRGPHSSDR
jgi:hypothetical protein